MSDYKSVFNAAVDKANLCQRDVGIYKSCEFGQIVYNSLLLPNKENRCSHELTCEVVSPGTPKM